MIDLTNSEKHAKHFKIARFSSKNATQADQEGSAMKWDAKLDAPGLTKTLNCAPNTSKLCSRWWCSPPLHSMEGCIHICGGV